MSYGDIRLVRKYCNFPGVSIPGEWQHSWVPSFYNKLPELILGSDGLSKYRKMKTCFVAREDQKDILTKYGYTKVHAIGLPIIYLNVKKYSRIPKSLLIMPDHTLDERHLKSRDQDYYEHLLSHKASFSYVTLCVHKSCFNKKRWQRLFPLADNIVIGAHVNDAQAYEKMAELLSTHEFMTTNDFGSHVAYAAFFGCKVSVSGPRPYFSKKDRVNSTLYRNCPECLEFRYEIHHCETFSKTYPFFMVAPHLAEKHEEWAQFELGFQCKKSPAELRKIFGWHYYLLPLFLTKLILTLPVALIKLTLRRIKRYLKSSFF